MSAWDAVSIVGCTIGAMASVGMALLAIAASMRSAQISNARGEK